MRKLVLAVIAVLAARSCVCRDEPSETVRVATFNIENFPHSARQIEGAFAEIARLGAPIVALQEITDPLVFDRAVRTRLGERWQTVFIETGSVLGHRLGVLYDASRFRHVHTRVHDGTRLGGLHKPVLDVELADRDRRIRVLVVHLKAGGDSHAVRTRQHRALRRIVDDVKHSGALVVLLGDFNATGDADREDLGAIELEWLTRGLACSAFWARDDGCPRSRLDHVLATHGARDVRAGGACAEHGCDWQDRCPLYAVEVSDHCPVVAEIVR